MKLGLKLQYADETDQTSTRSAVTLVALRVVILQTNLKLDGLHKLAGMLLRTIQDLDDALLHAVDVELAHGM